METANEGMTFIMHTFFTATDYRNNIESIHLR